MNVFLLTLAGLLAAAPCSAGLEEARAGAESGLSAAAVAFQGSRSARFAALRGAPKRDLTAEEKSAVVKALMAQLSLEEAAELAEQGRTDARLSGSYPGGQCLIKIGLNRRDQRDAGGTANVDVLAEVLGMPDKPAASRPLANDLVWGFSAATVPDYEKYEQVYSASVAPERIELVQAMAFSYTRRVGIDFDGKGRLVRMQIENYLAGLLTSSQTCSRAP